MSECGRNLGFGVKQYSTLSLMSRWILVMTLKFGVAF